MEWKIGAGTRFGTIRITSNSYSNDNTERQLCLCVWDGSGFVHGLDGQGGLGMAQGITNGMECKIDRPSVGYARSSS